MRIVKEEKVGEEVWRFERGVWSSMDSPVEFYDENGDPLETPAGYSPRTRWFGDEGELEIEVYSADAELLGEAPTPYLAVIYNMGDNIERVFVEDFPSLLQLLQEMAPLLELPNRGWEPMGEDEEEESEEI